MTQADFFPFEKISKSVMKKKLTEDKEDVHFAKVCCFKFEAEFPTKMFIIHLIDDEFKSANIGKRGQKISQVIDLNTLETKIKIQLK